MRRRLLTMCALALAAAPAGTAARDDLGQSMTYVRAAIPAIEAYSADHGTYRGMTMRRLRHDYDTGISHIRIVWATRTAYCVESTTLPKASKTGPAGDIHAGACWRRRA